MSQPSAKRSKSDGIAKELMALEGVSKGGLSRVLHHLHGKGLLTETIVDNPSLRAYQREIHSGVREHSLKSTTPHGPVVQARALPSEALDSWTIVHPLALLAYLSSLSLSFYTLMRDTVNNAGAPLTLLLYLDEVNPGNPLAPDPHRMFWAFYWVFKELPQWFIQRKGAWFCYGVLRTKIVNDISGGVGAVVKAILLHMFPEGGESFERGCYITHGRESTLLTAKFGGILADEAALKYAFGLKGQAGKKPCPSHYNVTRFVDCTAKPFFVNISCTDPTRFLVTTEAIVDAMMQRIRNETGKTARETLETNTGINFSPDGLLWCPSLKNRVVRLTDHYIRDWMHTLASNGVAGSELSGIASALNSIGVGLDIVRAYALQFTMPRNHGKVTDLYFKEDLFATDHVKHFAGDVLGMTTLMYMFLVEKIQPRGWIPTHIDCFKLLYKTLCILRRGVMTNEVHTRLKHAIVEHAEKFASVYKKSLIKIKFHHLIDLPDDLLRMGRVLGCFTAERKNKDLKQVAKNSFNTLESTVCFDYVNKCVERFCLCEESYKRAFLVSPKQIGSTTMSSRATTPSGDIHKGDVVCMTANRVGKIVDFFQSSDDDSIVARVHVLSKVGTFIFSIADSVVMFISIDEIVEPVAWYASADTLLHVALPCVE